MDTKGIRRQARAHLQGSWGLSIGVAVVACLLGGLLTGMSFLPEISYWKQFNFFHDRDISHYVSGSWEIVQGVRIEFKNGIFGLASFLLGGVLQLGYARFLLRQHDGNPTEFNDLFSQFDRFGTGFAQHFLRSLYTLLWSFLLIIPGIIAALSYAMTPFILEEHPELTANEAIRRSKELMRGHKTDLFILELTFIGWSLLCILTLNLGHIALNPYKNAAYAVFYREITKGP